jgi:hypothetical protein
LEIPLLPGNGSTKAIIRAKTFLHLKPQNIPLIKVARLENRQHLT